MSDLQPGMLLRPSPIVVAVSDSGRGAEPRVVVRVETVVGMAVYQLTTEQADNLGDALRSQARASKLGLAVVPEAEPEEGE